MGSGMTPDNAEFKVFSTKYALSRGIERITVKNSCLKGSVFYNPDDHYTEQLKPGEWHMTFESARAAAEAMREKEINRLEDQIEALAEITFSEPN